MPSDSSWIELELFLGMNESVVLGTSWRGTNEDAKLKKEEPFWNGSNTSGFSVLPAGDRNPDGSFDAINWKANTWSKTMNGALMYSRYVNGGSTQISRGLNDMRNGFSIRCIKVAE